MNTITLNLSIEETNLILEALGNLPYVRVFELVSSIQAQARQQVGQNGKEKTQAERKFEE